MKQVLLDKLEGLKIGKILTSSNLALMPLRNGKKVKPGYITLDDALNKEQARIREVSEEGDVNQVIFKNLSDKDILMVDGEELLGAKQNRIANITIMVPSKKEIIIPVSCVERSRWRYKSEKFSRSKHHLNYRARARKFAIVACSMKETGRPDSDQQEVWDDVAHLSYKMGVHSDTEAMSDVFDEHETSLEAIEVQFMPKRDQIGGVFCVDGKVIGMELFDSPSTYKNIYNKMIRSYFIETLVNRSKKSKPQTEVKENFERFMNEILSSKMDTYQSLGKGTDIRITNKKIAGGALVIEEKLIHLSVLVMQK
tara:strand:- start:365 stop:1297 length:933 start_codon:yes stop_codon:yes gene_type:complete